jgi:hypothetical protein
MPACGTNSLAYEIRQARRPAIAALSRAHDTGVAETKKVL